MKTAVSRSGDSNAAWSITTAAMPPTAGNTHRGQSVLATRQTVSSNRLICSITGKWGRPRVGSLSCVANMASTKPGIPTARNAARQPYSCSSSPPTQIPMTPPNAKPPQKTPSASARPRPGK